MWLQEIVFKTHGQYALPGAFVCRGAYLLLRGIGEKKLKNLLKEASERSESGAVSVAPAPHGLQGVRRISAKSQLAITFLCGLANKCGDHCPVTGVVHVFMFKCPLTLFGMFVDECKATNVAQDGILSQRGFYDLFEKGSAAHECIKHIKWKRQVTQKICSTCGGLACERAELIGKHIPQGSADWDSWVDRQKAHLNLIWVERRAYQDLRKAVRSGEIVDVTLDIIDASHPKLYPGRLFDSDASRAILQIGGAFIGAINHTTQRATLFMSAAPGIPVFRAARKATVKQKARAASTGYTWEGTDVNCTILLSLILNDYYSGQLRPVLHLQVDGGSDSRGFVLVELLGVLCALGIIEKAIIASLIPGHTHEDIDALFSVLTKALHSKADNRVYQTWGEIMECAHRVYPGWDVPTARMPGPTGVSELSFVWKFKEAFSQGPEFDVRPCLSPGLKGLFGAGTDHSKKPSRFEIVLGDSGFPVISAFLSSVPDAPIFGGFDKWPVFKYCPRLAALGFHDLRIGWKLKHSAMVTSLRAGKHYNAGLSKEQVQELVQMTCVFTEPPAQAIFFGKNPDSILGWQKLLSLGLAPLRGRRGAAKDPVPARAGAEPRRKRRGGNESDNEDSGVVYDSDDDENVGNLDADAGIEFASSSDSEEEISVIEPGAPVYIIEEWVDRRFNVEEQQNEYLIKYEGYEEPEWTLRRRVNGKIPKRIDDKFDSRDSRDVERARQERKKRLFREAAGRALGQAEEDAEAGEAATGSVPVAASASGAGAPAPSAPAPPAASAPAPRFNLRKRK